MAKILNCAAAPQVTWTTAARKATNHFGCYYLSTPRRRTPGTKSPAQAWSLYFGQRLAALNRANHSALARAWKNTLTPTNRANWATFAAGATIFSHDGTTHTPNAFQAYMAMSRFNSYFVWPGVLPNLKYPSAFPFINPTGPWTELTAPPVPTVLNDMPTGIFLTFTYSPAGNDLVIALDVARPGTPKRFPGPWFAAMNNGFNPDTYPPTLISGYTRLDYPFFPRGSAHPMTMAAALVSISDCQWSNWTLFDITP